MPKMADTIIVKGMSNRHTTKHNEEQIKQHHPQTVSSVSLSSEAQSEVTESCRSLVQRDHFGEKDKDMPSEMTETGQIEHVEEDRPREKSPASDITPVPSIGPVVLRDVKKKKALQRTCA